MWPSPADFSAAIQNPNSCFFDNDLKSCSTAIDKFGLPFVATGQFAAVFKLKNHNEASAIRCFIREMGDRVGRYQLIDSHLDRIKNLSGIDCLAKYEYDPYGILVGGKKYPILIMEWVDGVTLDVYVEQSIGKKDAMLYLANEWVRLIKFLRDAKIAHGDLQHGNIIVQTNLKMRLVDFDGMFVPGMEKYKACELGHVNYQHPSRDYNFFNLDLDNFSALAIYFSLITLVHQPELWKQFHNEGLVLKQNDFKNPNNSPFLKNINIHNPELKALLNTLIECCNKPIDKVPSLIDIVKVEPKSSLPDWITAPVGATVTVKTREATVSEVKTIDSLKRSLPVSPSGTAASPQPQTISSQRTTAKSFAFGRYIRSFALNLVTVIIPWAIICGLGRWNDGWVLICTIVCLIIAHVNSYREQNQSRPTPSISNAPSWRSKQQRPTSSYPKSTSTSGQGTVVGSRIRYIYHNRSCEWAYRISKRNLIIFQSVSEARSRGYRPCRACNP